MASADILRAARARIEDPKNWTRGSYAKDAEGVSVRGDSVYAVCWCALGALEAEGVDLVRSEEKTFLHRAARRLFDGRNAADVNDSFDHEDIMKVFGAAIAAAEAEAGR